MAFLISRIAWMGSGLGIVYLSSLYFHRFDFKQRLRKNKTHRPEEKQESGTAKLKGLRLDTLPALSYNYGIYPFVKTEFLMLIRHGNKWLWLLNAALWLALCLAPMEIAYPYMLPIILFLQVTRWSELVTKEKTNRVHYFAYASYKPLRRLLPAQILAGVMLAIVLSLPIIIRCALLSNYYEVLSIINGSIFIVMLAVALGVLTGGKKLYEVGFFMITYSVINKLPIADYLGSLPHQDMNFFMAILLAINLLLIAISFIVRNYQTSHL
ncbi:MAG: hypothetical protein EOO88_35320 [Pedobacter sp.]|nr:MAG: hypothetical protein EOO88_35320 [Pedobacter sp.]